MRYRVKADVLFFCAILTITYCSGVIKAMDLETRKPAQKVVGGPCEYKQYKGKATIVSVRQKKLPDYCERPSYETYDVKFCFTPEEKGGETNAKVEEREYVLMLTNSSYPGLQFLQKYGIEVGKSFDCYLKVITKGTCTPIIFDFPTIDLGDYFENEKH